jgi:hypothetical protein
MALVPAAAAFTPAPALTLCPGAQEKVDKGLIYVDKDLVQQTQARCCVCKGTIRNQTSNGANLSFPGGKSCKGVNQGCLLVPQARVGNPRPVCLFCVGRYLGKVKYATTEIRLEERGGAVLFQRARSGTPWKQTFYPSTEWLDGLAKVDTGVKRDHCGQKRKSQSRAETNLNRGGKTGKKVQQALIPEPQPGLQVEGDEEAPTQVSK